MTPQHTPASAGAVSAVQPATVDALPPLPHPDIHVTAFGEIVATDRRPFVMGGFFSADQMRKYALAAPPAPTPAVPVEAKQEPRQQIPCERCATPDLCGKLGCASDAMDREAAGTPAPAVPTEAIGRVLTEVMDRAVANGANSVSMPDDYVAIAAWLAGIPAAPAAPAPLAELAGAAKVLVDFARTAPGRLPSRVQEAISAIEREVRSTSPSVTHSGRIES